MHAQRHRHLTIHPAQRVRAAQRLAPPAHPTPAPPPPTSPLCALLAARLRIGLGETPTAPGVAAGAPAGFPAAGTAPPGVVGRQPAAPGRGERRWERRRAAWMPPSTRCAPAVGRPFRAVSESAAARAPPPTVHTCVAGVCGCYGAGGVVWGGVPGVPCALRRRSERVGRRAILAVVYHL